MYQAGIHRSFRASHYLDVDSVEEMRPHEHRYALELIVVGNELDENGVVIDRTVLDDCLTELLQSVEGRLMNDEPFFDDCPPTAENIAHYLCDEMANRLTGEGLDLTRLARLEVRLWESASFWASCVREPGAKPQGTGPSPRKRAPSGREPVKKPRRQG